MSADALNVAAHEMRNARMAQPRDLIPLRGDQAFRDAQPQRLDEAGLQLGDGHVAHGNNDGPRDNQYAENAEQQRQSSERGRDAEKAECRRRRPAQSAGRQIRSDREADERDEKDQTQGFEHRAEGDEERRRDASAAGKRREIAQKITQACGKRRGLCLIGPRAHQLIVPSSVPVAESMI